MPLVSFEKDVKPMFRPVDIAHMKPMGVKLDDYGYMSDPNGNYANAAQVQDTLSPQNGAPPTMPPRRAILDSRTTCSICEVAERWVPTLDGAALCGTAESRALPGAWWVVQF